MTFCSREKLRRRQVMFDQILRRRWNRICLRWLTCGAFLWCLRLSIYRWIHPWLQSSFCPLISFFPAFFNLFWFLFVSSVIKRSWRLKIRQTFIITTIIHTVHIWNFQRNVWPFFVCLGGLNHCTFIPDTLSFGWTQMSSFLCLWYQHLDDKF